MIEKKSEFKIIKGNKLFVVRLYAAKDSNVKAGTIVERHVIKRIIETKM